ncbi:MAG TPA: sensor domain-containing protein [Jatrophihabitans sp.]|jgi:signal transduction histidine kinase
MTAVSAMPAPFAVFISRRTWSELLYALLGLPFGIAGFTFVVTTLSVSVGLAVTFVGLPLLAGTGIAAVALADAVRRSANALAGADVAGRSLRPPPGNGVLSWIGAQLRNGDAWKARTYLVLKLPLGIASFVVATVFWAYGLGALSYAVWRPFLPCQTGADGRCHRGASLGSAYFIDTSGRIVLFAIIGVVLILCAPWVTRGIVRVDHAALRALVGVSNTARRVGELERSRAAVVDDAAGTLRRIERDLHDGTQARLVSLAMNVGLAREKLAEGGDPARAQELLDTAHRTAKEAIAEVRDLARGIHPAVLDTGLDAAIATLASHSAIPVTVQAGLHRRPDRAIETIAYFCTAELLTNAAKHSGANAVTVHAATRGSRLVVSVGDDGRGGAVVGAGTGLAGLAERVRAVDGSLTVDSPTGGPTEVTVDLPMELPR